MENQRRLPSESYSTHAIQYKFRITESLHSVPTDPTPCILAVAFYGPEPDHVFPIPCLHYSAFTRFEDYLDHYGHLLYRFLLDIYSPYIPLCCARQVARRFTYFLRRITAYHRCQGGDITAVYLVKLEVLLPMIADQDMERALRESFEMETARPSVMPATIDSIADLVKARAKEEREKGCEWLEKDRECVICMEEIETRKSSLRMPCSHVFHQSCLVKWLSTNHVCPLCRYEMPFDQSVV